MKIVRVKGGEYKDVLGSYSRYEDFDDGSEEAVFFYGYNSTKREDIKEKYAAYKRKVYLNLEHPCSFFTGNSAITSLEYFDEVYTICPYTAAWLNGRGKTKYIPIIEPYRKEHFEEYKVMPEKKVDVIYHGGIHSYALSSIIDVMSDYSYTFVSLLRDRRATHTKINSKKKWDLISEAKCSVAMNLLFPAPKHISNIRTYYDWYSNIAFSEIWGSNNVIPQMKARIVEAAACQTLNLVYKDKWNVIESWFSPDEFVYWETFEELRYLIDDISRNFHNYVPIIEKAHERVQKYTVKNFMKMLESR